MESKNQMEPKRGILAFHGYEVWIDGLDSPDSCISRAADSYGQDPSQRFSNLHMSPFHDGMSPYSVLSVLLNNYLD